MSDCGCGCERIDERTLTSGCACDHARFPPVDPIPPGLADLPRQRAGFGEYRDHLLSSVRSKPALDGWKARDNDDLGLMLFESWAYVLDVTGFYDARIAEEAFVRTAKRRSSVRKLTGLTGYRPRPAVGASVHLALLAESSDPVTLPPGTAFRSKAFDNEPPQVFELATAATLHPARNAWTEAPSRDPDYAGILAFGPGAPGATAGQIVLVLAPGKAPHAARVAELRSEKMTDGADYRVATLSPEPALDGVAIADIRMSSLSQSATPTLFSPSSGNAVGATFVILDSNYPQIRKNDQAIIEKTDGSLLAIEINNVTTAEIVLSGSGSSAVKTKVTKISFGSLGSTPEVARVHFRAVDAGRLSNPARTEFTPATMTGAHALEPPVRLPSDMEPPSMLIAKGEGAAGMRFEGTVVAESHGRARIEADSLLDAAADRLQGPITWYGNVVEVTRGQTVFNEVIGSGNSALDRLICRLRKKPLTYRPSPASASGVAPELEVRVNGILWTRADSLLTARPGDRVYAVRHDDDGGTDIVFGDVARPPTGNGNITATYRYEAGAATPPPGAINQLAKRMPMLLRVVSPMRGAGGSDAESPEEIRYAAPQKMMTMGRAISLADYEALSAAFPGVVNATAAWAWDGRFQRATVKAWIISNGATVAEGLASYLAGVSDGITAIQVVEAADIGATISVEIEHDPAYDRPIVVAAVEARLTDPRTGFFAPANVTIGAPFYRSTVVAAVMGVEGVSSVRSIWINGAPAPVAITVPEGSYLAFETVTIA